MMADTLIERLEAASGPDRGLDVLIGCAVGYVPDKPGCEWAKADHWQYVPVPRISERIGCADKAGNVAAHWEAPHYTASIDAAMTLKPVGWSVGQWSEIGKPDSVRIWNGEHDLIVHASTPALALCVAALCAQAQEGK